MASNKKTFKLNTRDKSKQLSFVDIEYLGGGAYSCEVHVDSSGFMCKREFGFDNDEYFLGKIHDVAESQVGEAELTDLQADSFIRFKPYAEGEIMVTGYIVEHTNVTQSIEFAFTVSEA
ncbi:MAG: hypothetical protein PVF28_03110, partial [Thioalkalispiraceae bacterium]